MNESFLWSQDVESVHGFGARSGMADGGDDFGAMSSYGDGDIALLLMVVILARSGSTYLVHD
jgi:hypothetical protein